MAAPKGNQYAVGNKGGAPLGNQNALGHGCGRPEKYDLDQEAKELDAWSLTEDATSLYEFTDKKEYLAQELTVFAQRNVNFSLSLKKAKERIAARREKACSKGTMNYGVWARSASLYDKMTYEHEEHIKDKEAERKKDSAPTVSPEALVAYASIMDQINSKQKKDE